MTFALAQTVADAVLYEGYVLYPYRASSAKNRVRFQFGVVAPRDHGAAGGSEPCEMQTECLVEPGANPVIDVKIRCLQLQARGVEAASGPAPGSAAETFRPVEFLDVGGELQIAWDEGVERELEICGIGLRDLIRDGAEREFPFDLAAGSDAEELRSPAGELCGRLVRRRWAISGVVSLSAQKVHDRRHETSAPDVTGSTENQEGDLLRLRVRIENRTPLAGGAAAEREAALRCSLVSAHTLLAVRDGGFVSLLDPAPAAASAAAGCVNLHTWPVLIGPEGSREVVLSSPIILYDYPTIAPESPGELCDSTEIDEILTLRIMTLTEEEKRQARGTDPRARRIIERADGIPDEILERLHGAVRSLRLVSALDPPVLASFGEEDGPQAVRPGPEVRSAAAFHTRDEVACGPPSSPGPEPAADSPAAVERAMAPELAGWESFLNPPGETPPEEAWLTIAAERVGKGARVRLRPTRRADSMDFFLAGREARVEAVFRDVENEAYVAVTLADDPAGDLHAGGGRFFYFYPDEIEPLPSEEPPGVAPGSGQRNASEATRNHQETRGK